MSVEASLGLCRSCVVPLFTYPPDRATPRLSQRMRLRHEPAKSFKEAFRLAGNLTAICNHIFGGGLTLKSIPIIFTPKKSRV
jgi:hypothetical protein